MDDLGDVLMSERPAVFGPFPGDALACRKVAADA
jgi:hypothetical protein